jgi:UDP-2,3-diacylglucosamine pyrophosphatase LpxH
MSKLLFIGDLHFMDDRPYFLKAGNDFIDFYSSLKDNNENNSVIFLGDLTENFLVSGLVVEQLF